MDSNTVRQHSVHAVILATLVRQQSRCAVDTNTLVRQHSLCSVDPKHVGEAAQTEDITFHEQ